MKLFRIHEKKTDYPLPNDAATRCAAFIGTRGGGKTYGATKYAEEMLKAKHQIVVLDPVGTWWGLRLPNEAFGGGHGYAISVFGGAHGDLELHPASGRLMADIVVEEGISAVFDFSFMSGAEQRRFAADFAEALLELKRAGRSPLHVFVEEMQEFCPQRQMAATARMTSAFEKLAKLGRNFGIGLSFITQRPQAVSKDALNQAEMLLVFRLIGPQERKAVDAWIRAVAVGKGRELLEGAAELETGTAIVWSPEWLKLFDHVDILSKTSFDASATPDAQSHPRELPPLNLDAIKTLIETFAKEQADVGGRSKSRARTASGARSHDVREPPAPAPAVVGGWLAVGAEMTSLRDELKVVRGKVDAWLLHLESSLKKLDAILKPTPQSTRAATADAGVFEPPKRATFDARRKRADSGAGGVDKNGLSRAPRALLITLGDWHPMKLSRVQLGTLAGYSHNSGAYRGSMAVLRREALIEEDLASKRYGINDAGLAAMPCLPVPIRDKFDTFLRHLRKRPSREIFKVLRAAWPGALTKDKLGSEARYSTASGAFREGMAEMRANELVEESSQGGIKLAAWLEP